MLSQRFSRAWLGLWFEHGERPEGHDSFRRLLAAYLAEVKPLAEPLKLNNELAWFGAMHAMIGRIAIRPAEGTQRRPDRAQQRDMADNA